MALARNKPFFLVCRNQEFESPGILTWGPYSFQHKFLGLDGDQPLGFDFSEISTNVMLERVFGVHHHGSVGTFPIDHPMPERLISFAVPFSGEEGIGRQGLPEIKRVFSRQGLNPIMV